jgi:hypothetical protein
MYFNEEISYLKEGFKVLDNKTKKAWDLIYFLKESNAE